MSTNVTINGVTYAQPDQGTPPPWGDAQKDIIVAIVSGMLQKAGGAFTLTSEVDFGASYGLKTLYYKSRTANPASAGQIRLAQADTVKWRNNANSADLSLSVSSDVLQFEGANVILANSAAFTAKLTDPMTTNADLITRAAGVPARIPIGTNGQVLTVTGGAPAWGNVPGTGDVVGPASSTDNAIVRFDGTTGKAIQNSGPTIADGGAINFVRVATASSASSAGETIIGVTSTAAARAITLANVDKVAGRIIIVKDESGGAQTNAITITPESGTIDGAADAVINTNYGSISFYSDGSNWFTFTEGQMVNVTTYKLITTASTNATSLKASAGRLYGYILSGGGSSAWFKMYNKASAPTVGTDTPVITVSMGDTDVNPQPQSFSFPDGIPFSTGIAFATTASVADSASDNAPASMSITLFYT